MSKTSNAVEILNRRFGRTAQMQEMLAEERVKSLAAIAIYEARTAAGLTQRQLADLVGTKQPVIARLEDADYEGHTVAMLQRIAAALQRRLDIRFAPLETTEEESAPTPALQEIRATLLPPLIAEVRRAVQEEIAAHRNRPT